MKKYTSRLLALATSALFIFSTGCQFLNANSTPHTHSFNKKVINEKYLQAEATCVTAASYYYSCSCGEAGTNTFTEGFSLSHDYSAKIASEQYLKKEATCQNAAEYFKSCTRCGQKTFSTFSGDELGEHSYTEEKPDAIYLKDEATFTSCAVYYKSCICGLKGDSFFSYGEPLRTYTEEEKIPYTPTSLTISLYDTDNSLYGFTYNTLQQPLRPVIQIAKGTDFTDYVEYSAITEKHTTTYEGKQISYYIAKAEVPLDDNSTYTYRAYDKYVDIGSEIATLETKDLTSQSFSFAHVSDTQDSGASGIGFGKVLSNITENMDFVLHTGDMVENSLHEDEWKNMLHENFQYLSKIPVMALSGNHETTYKNGYNETYKHFNNKIPQQDTGLGYYYSFTYGNAKFIMLNTNRLKGSSLTDDQYNWLISELENNTATWTIVALHNPLYSAGNYGSEPSRNTIALALRKQLQGIFADYGVDIVLQGHDHLVSRTYPIDKNGAPQSETWQTVDGIQYSVDPSGVLYVMDGPGGTQARSLNANMDASLYHYAKASKAYSWAEFVIDGNKLTVTVKHDINGSVGEYTSWGIIKSESEN